MSQTKEAKIRGRKPSFPGVETVPILSHIPAETRDMLRAEAERREEPMNVTLNRMIQSSFREAERRRKQG